MNMHPISMNIRIKQLKIDRKENKPNFITKIVEHFFDDIVNSVKCVSDLGTWLNKESGRSSRSKS